MLALSKARIPFRSSAGALIAHVLITPDRDATSVLAAPLIEIESADAEEYGETRIQLRESETYEYEIEAISGEDLRLRCSLARRRRTIASDERDAGRIDTSSWCGTLLLELVDGTDDTSDTSAPPLGSALVDVRSVKLDYRTEYRGMLRRVASELADLIADARASAKVPFRSSFEERRDAGWMQIQVELLREILDGADFGAALQRIITFPHERLGFEPIQVRTDRQVKWNRLAVQQFVTRYPRRAVPSSHPLRMHAGLRNIAEQISYAQKRRDLDTAENRFVKFALRDFHAFISRSEEVFELERGWEAAAATCHRLSGILDEWLGRAFFQEIGEFRFAPLGSPALQRKGGYRELLRWWLRFRTAAELSWDGGEELFHAGQRDIAQLYEYWLFFELLNWFYQRCGKTGRPAVEQLIEGLDGNRPNLRLKKHVQLGPFVGAFVSSSRRLNARFTYNRRFNVSRDREQPGSWTRRLHPDYTLTFWPEGLDEAEAERVELLVHVHFDAKYRVENIEGLFGTEETDDVDEEQHGNYKRQDLLKMHAYRDAIKRSHGAYVLYPGRRNPPVNFRGFFHEILPGLGAFAIAPDESGTAQGMPALEAFLEEILMHLANRTTAQERISYHVSEAYRLQEPAVSYGAVSLPEKDIYAEQFRAPPPAEDMVLFAWYNTDAQRQLAESNEGFAYIRLGLRAGAFHVHPNLARVRHILLRTSNGVVAPGLLSLREPGFRVYSREQLRDVLRQHARGPGVAAWKSDVATDAEDYIYALFHCRPDFRFANQVWDGQRVMELVEAFETDARNKLVENVRRTSPYPRILPLRELLKARL
jgi:predicted component of viral defense system (DUF524 family)